MIKYTFYSMAIQKFEKEQQSQMEEAAFMKDYYSKKLEIKEEISEEQLEIESKEILEDFVTRSAQRNLEIPRGSLRSERIPEQLRFELEDAQTEWYLGALADPEVHTIGFTGDPIKASLSW